ncbi:hypothetical protein PAXINDRAFT_16641 [Paxillus involutus ATCC 200175]|uniref:Uncharacterized protein n=1 Tax=Paxillus involutus ATCC 200175 TaxID=664439 RepID=A0A0C9TRB3_PAXIN|nr:hypothetical protein PAXINDRAFT_16641 [Paxillus involutus ATCC 200175]
MPSSQDDDGKVDNIQVFAHRDAVAKGGRQCQWGSRTDEIDQGQEGKGENGNNSPRRTSNDHGNAMGLRNAYNF